MNRSDALSRRALLTSTALTVAAAAATTGLPRTARAQGQQKVSKKVAQYQDHPKGEQRCEICINFQPPNQCRFVEGDISPKGWCVLFAARENAQ